ncbi:MAG TPA: cysteine desulfurase [Candidatus Hydrogenedentes bacterium]|nr:cysteine desulfurase [Candidatus Hydrogenedentota bacterium]
MSGSTAVKIDARPCRQSCQAFSVEHIRKDFPILNTLVRGKPLVYLDNAATTQKPQAVIDAINHYYTAQNANVHRGVHHLSQVATCLYDDARQKIAAFLNATVECEIIFTRGTTESINLVAQSYGRQTIHEGDEIIISGMEHHSNIVPWQILCQQTGAKLRVIPFDDDGNLIMDEFDRMLNPRTKMVAVVHVSNALGTVNPIQEITAKAHAVGARVLVDGAQSTPHTAIDLKALDCDFFACSGHKMYGPTGIGILYGRAELLDAMPPYQSGGDMILSVTFDKTIYGRLPSKFEAGTPHIEGAIALGAAVDYLNAAGMETIHRHEQDLLQYATDAVETVPGLHIMGRAREKAGVLAFTMDAAHPHDVGQILDEEGVAVRAGHHCAQPVMQRFGVPATTRASFGMYNNRNDVDALVAALHKVNKVFA